MLSGTAAQCPRCSHSREEQVNKDNHPPDPRTSSSLSLSSAGNSSTSKSGSRTPSGGSHIACVTINFLYWRFSTTPAYVSPPFSATTLATRSHFCASKDSSTSRFALRRRALSSSRITVKLDLSLDEGHVMRQPFIPTKDERCKTGRWKPRSSCAASLLFPSASNALT